MSELMIGDFASVRGRTWIVDSVTPGAIDKVSLVCVDDDAQGERIDLCPDAEINLQKIGDSAWSDLTQSSPSSGEVLGAHLQVTGWNTASAADRKLFQAPFRAGIRLDAYQLAPLRKALDLPRVNLLIADDVGLGKTVEAGLVARELLLRRRIDFIVVTAPASMLLQWQDEMAQKFGLDITIVDRDHLLETRRSRGFGANPWALGNIFAISHSILSDEVYMAPLRGILGDFRSRSMLILDEAHHVAPSGSGAYAVESQLTRSVRDLAARFEHRLFLTATPHNGHSNAFATLLEILDPQRFTRGIAIEPRDLSPVMVRRLKEDLRQLGVPFPERRVEAVRIDGLAKDATELRLAAMLADHVEAAGDDPGAKFAFATMQQRLFSSIAAFHRTLTTHRKHLGQKSPQMTEDTTKEISADEIGEMDAAIEAAHRTGDGGRNTDALSRIDAMISVAAEAKDRPDHRIAWIIDWMKSEMLDGEAWRDRRLIIFTEWEDTRRWLETRLTEALHELGVDPRDRIESFTGRSGNQRIRDHIARNFNAPFDEADVRILLCTDAAREGINLQARCHDLLHFDLPWNPSRLEQRNGRIDRKLQPAEVVTCRYFIYEQREEDRVLDALVRKTETIRRELGASGQIIRDQLEDRLNRDGIRRGQAAELSADFIAMGSGDTASREVGDAEGARQQAVKQEIEKLEDLQERSRKKIGVEASDLARVFGMSLGTLGAALTPGESAVSEAVRIEATDGSFNRDGSWQPLFDELRPGRPPKGRKLAEWRDETAPRDLLFEPARIEVGEPEPQDVVQLHLEHRLVKRVLGRFLSRGIRDRMDRVAAIVGPGAQPRVVLLGRLALYGPEGRRLHEEIIPVTARWRDRTDPDVVLSPYAEAGEETTLRQLLDALRVGRPASAGVQDRIASGVEADLGELRTALEAKAATAQSDVETELATIADKEAKSLEDLLRRQLKRVEEERTEYEPPQASFDLRTDKERERDERERRQREADRRSWDGKIERLTAEIETEPDRVRDGYRVVAHKLDPLGLVYLWPEG